MTYVDVPPQPQVSAIRSGCRPAPRGGRSPLPVLMCGVFMIVLDRTLQVFNIAT